MQESCQGRCCSYVSKNHAKGKQARIVPCASRVGCVSSRKGWSRPQEESRGEVEPGVPELHRKFFSFRRSRTLHRGKTVNYRQEARRKAAEGMEKLMDEALEQNMSVTTVQDGDWQDVWNDYLDWVAEENKKKVEERMAQSDLPVKIELLKQKIRNW